MMYNSLFDYTLKWLNETDTRSYEEIAVNSETWGNYRDNSIKYKESANGIEIIKNEDVTIKIPTGGIIEITYNGEIYSDSPTASNNIFDLSGNVFTWNQSRVGQVYRCLKGNSFVEYSKAPVYRINNGQPYANGPHIRCSRNSYNKIILKFIAKE